MDRTRAVADRGVPAFAGINIALSCAWLGVVAALNGVLRVRPQQSGAARL